MVKISIAVLTIMQ